MTTKPKPRKLDRFDIKSEVHRKGMTLTRLAEINDLNPNSFRGVWSRTNRKAEAAIAAFLEMPVETLFPDRYPVRTSSILSSKYEPDSESAKADAAQRAA